MNKKYGISSRILMVVLLFVTVIAGCKSGGSKAQEEELTVNIPENNEAVYEDIKQAERIFNALPSPLESAMLIKSAGARFDEGLFGRPERGRH